MTQIAIHPRYAADPQQLHLSPVGKQISALSDRWTASEPPKYNGGGGGSGSGDDGDGKDEKFFAVVLGSAGADAHIREALEQSPFAWDTVGYEPRSSRYRLNAASLALLERADVLARHDSAETLFSIGLDFYFHADRFAIP